MSVLTMEEAEAAQKRHEVAEMAEDFEATIATLASNPFYELPVLGYRIEGFEAVKAFYSRTLPFFAKREIYANKRVHALAPEDRTLVREAHVFLKIDGKEVRCNYAAMMAFDEDGQILSERLYTDPLFAELFGEALGEGFLEVPGVSRMPWTEFTKANS